MDWTKIHYPLFGFYLFVLLSSQLFRFKMQDRIKTLMLGLTKIIYFLIHALYKWISKKFRNLKVRKTTVVFEPLASVHLLQRDHGVLPALPLQLLQGHPTLDSLQQGLGSGLQVIYLTIVQLSSTAIVNVS
jgi:hypothetical protein